MSALHQVLNELAINVLPAQQRAGLIASLARQHGLDDALTAAMQNGNSEQLSRLTNQQLSACMVIVAPDTPAFSSGCHFIVASEVPNH
ncbi:hypothetical protein [Rheinheimera sp.]|uniref:hypothetical protein n=1 Tax=Rheinheimera sp. TaxID=1869214 RepID=UPI003D29BB85